jgi:predicted dinucleotide-binding enzyme
LLSADAAMLADPRKPVLFLRSFANDQISLSKAKMPWLLRFFDPGAVAGTLKELLVDYVLLAVPWKNVEAALQGLPEWNGRVLIDATNPFVEISPKLILADLGGIGASEIVAGFAPGARILKAFNSIRMDRFNEGLVKGQSKRVIFVSGDDEEPKRVVKDLIESFGFVAIDLGGLVTGGRIQQAVAVPGLHVF